MAITSTLEYASSHAFDTLLDDALLDARLIVSAPRVEITSPSSPEEWAETRNVVQGIFDYIKQGLDFDMLAEQEGAREEMANLERFYAPPRARMFVGKLDGRIVASTGLHLDTPEFAELKRVFVRPEARGHSLAPRLLDAAIAQAGAWGARSVWLETAPQIMQTAVRMYREHGFREVGTYTVNGVTGLVMEKPLIDPDAPVPTLEQILALSGFTPDGQSGAAK